ncbi:uncharacterized protein LOC126374504 [Pectinophora gossypiella]|uniref:uncharacterized protein LOC126374504 n=1 Tax=Pectinophora gossypiella TaxID=13191 RepID=UPI00214F5843|nr:uncharacterized protein LOC126374504 [Pectinophora gossypiella]
MATKIYVTNFILLIFVVSSLQSVVERKRRDAVVIPVPSTQMDTVPPPSNPMELLSGSSNQMEVVPVPSNPKVAAWLKENMENNPHWEKDLAGWMNAPNWIKH